jgi:hypothetical protein
MRYITLVTCYGGKEFSRMAFHTHSVLGHSVLGTEYKTTSLRIIKSKAASTPHPHTTIECTSSIVNADDSLLPAHRPRAKPHHSPYLHVGTGRSGDFTGNPCPFPVPSIQPSSNHPSHLPPCTENLFKSTVLRTPQLPHISVLKCQLGILGHIRSTVCATVRRRYANFKLRCPLARAEICVFRGEEKCMEIGSSLVSDDEGLAYFVLRFP